MKADEARPKEVRNDTKNNSNLMIHGNNTFTDTHIEHKKVIFTNHCFNKIDKYINFFFYLYALANHFTKILMAALRRQNESMARF